MVCSATALGAADLSVLQPSDASNARVATVKRVFTAIKPRSDRIMFILLTAELRRLFNSILGADKCAECSESGGAAHPRNVGLA